MGRASKSRSQTGGADRERRALVRRAGRRSDTRRVLRRLVGVLCVCLGATFASSVPALALSQRGHSFAFSFGGAGSGDGEFTAPSGIAVSESTGDVYVTDGEANRVEQFRPETGAGGEITGYKFESAWGWGVRDGKKEYEVCTSACEAGIKGAKFFDSPGGIAVDNSTSSSDPSKGDVYVLANHVHEKGLVYKFGPNGEPVGAAGRVNRSGEQLPGNDGAPLPAGEKPMSLGLTERELIKCKRKTALEQEACDAAEKKCKEEIAEGKPGTCEWELVTGDEAGEELAEELEVLVGVAVDQNGTVWVGGEDDGFRAFDGTGHKLAAEPEAEVEDLVGGRVTEVPLRAGLAVTTAVPFGSKGAASQDHLYFNYEPSGEEREGKKGIACKSRCLTGELDGFDIEEDQTLGIPEEEEGGIVNPELSGASTSGVAVDEVDGDQYLDSGTSIDAIDSGNSQIERFGSSETGFAGLADGGPLAVDHAAGPEVGDVYALDLGSDTVDVFEPSSPGAPSVDALSTPTVESEAAVVSAAIDPDGAKTTYIVSYEAPVCTGTPSSCAGEAPIPAQSVEGFGDQTVSVSLSGLSPSTTYHFRVIAQSADGKVESKQRSFTTRASQVESVMLDGRVWEQVSPANKHAATIEPLRREGGLIQAASEGGSIAFVAIGGAVCPNEPAGSRSPEATEIIGRRGSTGWSCEDIATANEAPAEGVKPGLNEYQFFSPDLSSALVEPFSHVSLSPEIPERAEGSYPVLYVRDNDAETCPPAPQTCYTPLVTSADDNAVNGKGEPTFANAELNFEGATSDLQHVVIGSNTPLTAEAATGESLYMWSAGRLQLISVLANGEDATSKVTVGDGNFRESQEAAISDDGSRVVWEGETSSNAHAGLHMRELEHEGKPAVTYEISEPNAGVVPKSISGAKPRFQGASADGSKVFFTDQEGLTANAENGTRNARQENLYVFEPGRPAGERLTDLTPATSTEEGGGLQGDVLGVSQDGTLVYFVADGRYQEGSAQPVERGDCSEGLDGSPHGAACNLYVERYAGGSWQSPQFIARLSAEDQPDWALIHGGIELAAQPTRVSPNGEYLAFMSDRSLTGYDNEDVNSETKGERLDEEVYLYKASDGRLICASCNPSGARPRGVFDQHSYANPEGAGPLVDRLESWQAPEEERSISETQSDPWLAGNVPGWSKAVLSGTYHQPRYLSDSGRLFFNSADPLVALKDPTREEKIGGKSVEVGVENVYEYEPQGVGDCSQENTEGGCVALISSGESTQESTFLDASESGDEAFFLTSAKLVAQDTDTEYDLYDAHVCAAEETCPAAVPDGSPEECTGESSDLCRPGESSSSSSSEPATTTPGSGNVVPHQTTLGAKAVQQPKVKPLTKAQELAKALKSCRKDKKKKKRLACERTARKRYGAKSAKKASTKKKKS
jgi:hypothetical protein